jgi:hypothetical protein
MDETEGALLPFWSPDSHFIGFWAQEQAQTLERQHTVGAGHVL